MDIKKSSFKGSWRDIEYYTDGRIIVGEWQPNIMVNGVNLLIASYLKNEGIPGISHWAVGEGDPNWDEHESSLTPYASMLINEIGRKPVSHIIYINESNEPSEVNTNRLLVTCIFETGDCIGTWREFALFGGDANMTLDSGIMINHKAHQKYLKTINVTVERQIRFIFE